MDSKMTPEYKVISEQVEKIIKGSNLPEVQKYSLLAGCMTKVAHEYNGTNFEAIKVKLALVSKTMLNAVEKAEQIFGKFKKITLCKRKNVKSVGKWFPNAICQNPTNTAVKSVWPT